MRQDLYIVEDVVETVYDPELRSIIVTWHDFSRLGVFRPCLEAQVKCVKEDGAKIVLVDTRKAKGMLEQVDQKWLSTDVFPVYEEYGLKAVITILPKSALTLLSAKQWQISGNAFGVDFVDTASYSTAMELVEKYLAQPSEGL